jgi:hypothetical protein
MKEQKESLIGLCIKCKDVTFEATKEDFDGYCLPCAILEYGQTFVDRINATKGGLVYMTTTNYKVKELLSKRFEENRATRKRLLKSVKK